MRGKAVFLVVLCAILASAVSGCSSGSAVEFEVEKVERKGKNLYPIKQEVLKDAKENIDIWINRPEKIKDAFTGTALNDYSVARTLDKKEGVKRVRVHENQKFVVLDIGKGVRPQVEYSFLDMSYFVDARTGKPKTKPYNKERKITIFLVREGNRWKIDNMVGAPEALR